MKAVVAKASDWDYHVLREFESLEDAVDTLKKETGTRTFVVERFEPSLFREIYINDDEEIDWYITVYDYYLE